MFDQTIGSRRQVWNGTAKKTPGGLHKSDLIMNKHRRIVSRKKSVSSKKHNRLLEYGYGTEKGQFGFVKIGSKKRGRKGKKGKKMRVYEIAKQLDIPSKDVKMYLEYIGQPVKSASSSVEPMFGEIVVRRINESFKDFVPYWVHPPF